MRQHDWCVVEEEARCGDGGTNEGSA